MVVFLRDQICQKESSERKLQRLRRQRLLLLVRRLARRFKPSENR
jgi:hypothetical protein